MTNQLLTLCQALNMPQTATEEILTHSRELSFSSLQPAMDMLFREETWEDGLSLLKAQLGDDDRGMKMLTCMLVCALQTRINYKNLGISDEIFLATMDCFPRFVQEHMESYGSYGFDRDFWTVRQLSGVLFRIGLLEYELSDGQVCLHIPTGAHLISSEIDISLEKARGFISRFFPAWAASPMTCHSWLLSPALPGLLSPDSNILQFQNRFRIIPEKEQNKEFLVWIFKNREIPYPQLPENTSLQRIIKQYLLQGGTFVEGRGILL